MTYFDFEFEPFPEMLLCGYHAWQSLLSTLYQQYIQNSMLYWSDYVVKTDLHGSGSRSYSKAQTCQWQRQSTQGNGMQNMTPFNNCPYYYYSKIRHKQNRSTLLGCWQEWANTKPHYEGLFLTFFTLFSSNLLWRWPITLRSTRQVSRIRNDTNQWNCEYKFIFIHHYVISVLVIG